MLNADVGIIGSNLAALEPKYRRALVRYLRCRVKIEDHTKFNHREATVEPISNLRAEKGSSATPRKVLRQAEKVVKIRPSLRRPQISRGRQGIRAPRKWFQYLINGSMDKNL